MAATMRAGRERCRQRAVVESAAPTAAPPSSVPPTQNVRQNGLPSRRAALRNWNIATTSSMAGEIMISIAAAVTRHRVHHAPTATGCRITSTILTTPSGTTSTPNIATIHGIVRHRLRPPMKPDSASSM
jgi:hypothetical protein